jgi:hypothetical protein
VLSHKGIHTVMYSAEYPFPTKHKRKRYPNHTHTCIPNGQSLPQLALVPGIGNKTSEAKPFRTP